jgi:hypothetical protein
VVNRAEFTDLMLWNDPLGNVGGNSITNPSSTPGSLQITNEASVRFAEVGMKFQNKLMRQLWDGNPANNTGGGGYREFNGLDILISTGHTDAVTGVSCPTLDSTIMNAAFLAVTDVSAPATSIINRLTYMLRSLRNLASRTGLDPVQHVLVMREELFYELTAVWPCNYLTYRCMTMSETGATYVGDPGDAIAMRDAMRQGSYIIVDGVQYPVAIDDGMAELTNADNGSIPVGSFASDIVILPHDGAGQQGQPVLGILRLQWADGRVQRRCAGCDATGPKLLLDRWRPVHLAHEATDQLVRAVARLDRAACHSAHASPGWADQQHRLHASAQRARCVQRPA